MPTRVSFLLIFSTGIVLLGIAQAYLFRKIQRQIDTSSLPTRVRQLLVISLATLLGLLYLPHFLRIFYKWPEHEVSTAVLYGVLYPVSLWGLSSVSICCILLVKDLSRAVLRGWRRLRDGKSPAPAYGRQVTRRDLLRWTFAATAASPIGTFTYGAAIGKERYEIVERSLVLPSLAPALSGLQVVQLTDIHVGNFMKQEQLERYVRVVNELKPDLVALTGDFIASSPEFIPPCAAALAKLQAREGVFACLGNHDHWVGAQQVMDALEAAGVEVLRNAGRTLSIRGAQLNVAGVDDPWRGTVDFDRALAPLDPTAPTVLLAHQPDLFPAAARRRVDLTLAGHYHGGQIKLRFTGFDFSAAHLVSEFVEGHFTRGRSQLYVSRGIGITGPPVRLNAPPEITLLQLRSPPQGG